MPLKRPARELPALPGDLEIPSPPQGRLPAGLRVQLVEWLTPVLADRLKRLATAQLSGLERQGPAGSGSL
jgi:hypothetical protein